MSDMSEAPRPDAGVTPEPGLERNMRLLSDIPVRMSVEVGSTQLRLADIMALGEGSVVQLDRQADELLDIMVNGTLVARGEVVTINGRYGIRVTEVAATDARLPGIERRV
ncbi:MAG TPA: flagellar motor switch protein FliN [Sphingobium sp.]|nr:flagellar motor switch protein FliN [Sphingobium sp.]